MTIEDLYGIGFFVIAGGIVLAVIFGIFMSVFSPEKEDEFVTDRPSKRVGKVKDKQETVGESLNSPKEINLNSNSETHFQQSGWVTGFVVLGWIAAVICFVCLILGLVTGREENFIYALINFASACTCFFKAHLLRIFEKGVHHAGSIDRKLSQPGR